MSPDHTQRVGFVGLGDQGGPMAVAIAEAGFPLHVWARRPQSYEALSGVKFERHGDLASLAGSVDLLALCLRDDQDIDDLMDQHGLLNALRRGSTVVNHGTGDPTENERFAVAFAVQDVTFLDAPVSGGRPGAIGRTLTTMVGGDHGAFERCRPVFDSFSRKVAHMGPVGSGQLTKLLNNALTMTNLKNAADVFGVASRLGIDLRLLQDVIAVSSGSSAILQAIGTHIDATAAAHLQSLMRKDIEHFADAVRGRGIDPSELRDRGIGGAGEVVDLATKLERS
ncbi:NAD(P)-dependent oxidoreductase [Sphingomonas sp. PB4P5]|uniref:NAD(P)-dependent oxidoreductase n=1 Tax=Parasphingomonas puruogangriensis TaxID=3096155 RepID=UPI002FCC74DA